MIFIIQDYVDPEHSVYRPDILMVILTAAMPAIYTALGGLKVSLYTDQLQGILGVIMLIFVFCWVCAKYRPGLDPVAYQQKQLGRGNYIGAETFGSFAISLFCPSVYNESFWQRAWAAKSSKVLLVGSMVGGFFIFLVIFFFGTLGVISAWGNATPIDDTGESACSCVLMLLWLIIYVFVWYS